MNESPVYIIDDEPDVRRLTSWMVQELGYLNYPFATATDFIEALPHLKPGCVLVDLRMEDMSGIDMIHATAAVRSSGTCGRVICGACESAPCSSVIWSNGSRRSPRSRLHAQPTPHGRASGANSPLAKARHDST